MLKTKKQRKPKLNKHVIAYSNKKNTRQHESKKEKAKKRNKKV